MADSKNLPRVAEIPPQFARRWGVTGTMVIPAPQEVDEVMRRVPRGKVITINAIRAAGEDEAEGRRRVTPYWRTLKGSGELNQKYPGGLARQKKRLRAEGHAVVTKGKRAFVADYESRLAKR